MMFLSVRLLLSLARNAGFIRQNAMEQNHCRINPAFRSFAFAALATAATRHIAEDSDAPGNGVTTRAGCVNWDGLKFKLSIQRAGR